MHHEARRRHHGRLAEPGEDLGAVGVPADEVDHRADIYWWSRTCQKNLELVGLNGEMATAQRWRILRAKGRPLLVPTESRPGSLLVEDPFR